MKVKGFITITPYDEKKRGEDRKPLGKAMINVDEIALIMSVADKGAAVCLKDYNTKIFCFDTEKDIKYKIIAARGETK